MPWGNDEAKKFSQEGSVKYIFVYFLDLLQNVKEINGKFRKVGPLLGTPSSTYASLRHVGPSFYLWILQLRNLPNPNVTESFIHTHTRGRQCPCSWTSIYTLVFPKGQQYPMLVRERAKTDLQNWKIYFNSARQSWKFLPSLVIINNTYRKSCCMG